MSPQLAWNPFYKGRQRESWGIGKRCKDPEWDDDGEEEIEDIEKEEVGENKQLEKSEKVDMTPTCTNSEKSESPFLSADAHLPSSPCLSHVWSSQLPLSVHQDVPNPPLLSKQCRLWWRPLEIGNMVPNRRSDENQVEGST